MKRQNLDGGGWFNLESASHYSEDTYWDGRNHISVVTGSQWDHEAIYRTAKGRWVKNSWSQWQGSGESWQEISQKEAYNWLLKNNYHDKLPAGFLQGQEV